MEKELQTGMIELQRLQDDAERALQQERAEEFERIESQVIPLIAAVAEERGYTLVFNKFQSGLLFATESVDITETILQRFDAASQPDGG
jgi:Skp family chaperone for outer membrane proteins